MIRTRKGTFRCKGRKLPNKTTGRAEYCCGKGGGDCFIHSTILESNGIRYLSYYWEKIWHQGKQGWERPKNGKEKKRMEEKFEGDPAFEKGTRRGIDCGEVFPVSQSGAEE